MSIGSGLGSAMGLPSPGISIEFHDGDGDAGLPSALDHPNSAPAHIQQFKSPMRHHRRTPSAHREVKETLNARSEYMSDDLDGQYHHCINQYILKDEIGRGSYGAVYLATDQFGNEFAVKAFSKSRLRKRAQSNILRRGPRGLGGFPPRVGFGAPDAANTRFSDQKARESQDALFLIREEIAIMKKLNHPNLVQLIEVLDDPEEDSLFMVLEMCKKGVVMKIGLGEPSKPYPEEECRCWFRDLILGIEYLHSQGVVHRDIKPDNLLLTGDDVLKIVDFGVSEIFEKTDEMRTAKPAGSPAFLPPELCVAKHGDVSGKAADIWSMGVSLYCLRYGRLPFERDNVLEMYEAIKTETPQLPPDENADFVDLMGRLMEKDPEKRITMAELREHPWVTKGGEDPLLSAEENCSDPVDLPNALEVNHAFTRRMSHLLCVVKAIRKFKSLLGPKGDGVPPQELPSSTEPEKDTTRQPDAVSGEKEEQPLLEGGDSTVDHAKRVLMERENFLKLKGNTRGNASSRGRQAMHDLTITTDSVDTLLLGIGTGGMDDFSREAPEADIISDSPTVVDFNIYDQAFEAEVDRIKRSSSLRRGGGDNSRKGTGTLYHTKLNERSHYRTDDENLTWAAPTAGGSKSEAVPPKRSGFKFAQLVAQAVQDAKDGKEKAAAQ
ncbi:kinase-like domain-containing protein [Lasiosphaeria miniovina]|uniref:Kinase-like domain-containing protein n=1 Tax=Lasiosphaeria miniovina TaxID=1954250 RepID=A0AA40AVZ2_9PEZI|nr:kinase-like domain-containing protein [Lasiosphaeria miniovina]KAK0722971.1 kinase-like domain-containing protein [Lasiosphaeria miniovina]